MAVDHATVVEKLLDVLREAVEGPRESWSYFTDNAPDAGWVGTLACVDAERASRSVHGSSIAAHVHHAAFGMRASAEWIAGRREWPDWRASWSVERVDEAAWRAEREALLASYARLRATVEDHALDDGVALGEAIGAIAHAAYHLGAARQKVLGAGAQT